MNTHVELNSHEMIKGSASCWNPDLTDFTGPKYKALADAIEQGIKEGTLASGEKLPTHRHMADLLDVTIGTVTRGYAEAERRRLVTARVGSGTYISGKSWNKVRFNVPVPSETAIIDLSLTLAVPGNREQLLAETLKTIASDSKRLHSLLDYLPETGIYRHRSMIAQWLKSFDITASPENILITNGGQHANMMALQAVTRPGDVVVSEELTYPGFINSARQWQTRHLGLPMDEHGLIPEALDQCCYQHRPRLLYLMPAIQNPTASVMPLERRQQILAVAQRHNLLILEDDVQFVDPAHRLPTLYSMAPEQVIYTGSFSKSLAGGLRVGFICYPDHLREKLAIAMRSDCWLAPPLMVEVASEWIESGLAIQLIEWQTQVIKSRQAMLASVLKNQNIKALSSGFHAWLTLPEPWRAETLVRQLNECGIRVLQSELFAVGSTAAPQAVRICISSSIDSGQIKIGLERIRDILAIEPMPIHRTVVF